jgi:hypothetical protein
MDAVPLGTLSLTARHAFRRARQRAIVTTLLITWMTPLDARALATPQAPTAASSAPTETDSIGALPNGGSVRLPTDWTSRIAGDVLQLVPPPALAAEHPGLGGICSNEPWTLGPISDPAVVAALQTQYASVLEGFEIDGEPVVNGDTLRMRFRQSGLAEGSRLHLFVRVESGRVATLAVAGPGRVLLDAEETWTRMFESMSMTGGPRDARSGSTGEAIDDGLAESRNAEGGYALRHDRSWTVRSEGATSVLLPDPNAVGGDDPEFYAISSMPWNAGESLVDPTTAERAARDFLADAPGVRRDGAPERIADDTVLLRCSADDAQGRPMRLHVIARQRGRAVFAVVTSGTDATIAARSQRARSLAATLRPIEAASSATARGDLDASIVGRWSTDEVMSSGSGFDAGGSMTMVTQRIIDLGANGTFTVGSRSAGGSASMSFGSDFEIDARGRWRVERRDGAAYIVMSDEGGGAERVRYALHEGQLVLGEPGSRAFWSRMR